MKKLIILLFIASSVIGQVDNEKYLRGLDSLTAKMDSLTVTRISWLDEFISLWDEYAKECRDTLIYDLRNGWFENEKGELLNEPKIISRKSFIGFIEYLKRKRGGK